MSLANLTEDLASEQGQGERHALLLAAIEEINDRTNSSGDAMLVSGSRRKFRCGFNTDTELTDNFVVVTGTNQTAAVSGGALVITSGTTAGAETTVTSRQSFTVPFKTSIGLRLSQKIANQEFYVEVVAETTDGAGVDEGVVAAWRIAGSDTTNNANARVEVRNSGAARVQSSNIGTQQHVGADSVFEITIESDETWFTTKAMDSTASRLAPFLRNSVSPDPNRRYRIRLRARNGATAPASNTTATVYFVTSLDYTEQQVEVTGGSGSVGAGQGIPVNIVSGATTGNPTLAASSNTTGVAVAKVQAAASTNATLVKNGNARVYGYDLSNTSASWRYVRLFNKGTAPVPGTDTVFLTIAIPPNSDKVVHFAVPLSMGSGLGYAVTGGNAENDATAVTAGDVVGHIDYV